MIMNEGRVEQSGTPEDVYEHPATPFVYGFLGDVNLFHGRIDRGRVKVGASIEAHIPRAHYDTLGLAKGQRVFVSPTSVKVFAGPTDGGTARSA